MALVRQSGTAPEMAARRLLHSAGVRFRVTGNGLPGSPDIVNRSAKWAIFVHGCFWHAHENCPRWKLPGRNKAFWRKKFLDNRRRDQRKHEALENSGFAVLTIWECELKNESSARTKLLSFVKNCRAPQRSGTLSVKTQPSKKDSASPRRRGSYHRTSSGKFVSRVVMLSGTTRISTRRGVPAPSGSKYDAQSVFDKAFLLGYPLLNVKETSRVVRCVDLFSGCGGLSLGAREACAAIGSTFEPVLAVDQDAASLTVYQNNFSPRRSYGNDIRLLLDGELGAQQTTSEKSLKRSLGAVQILLAGPPCQGHSDLNNATRRNDKRNRLYERVARFAEIIQPEYVLIENVPTVVHGRDRALDKTVETLQRSGYFVDAGVVDLSTLGVPQRRKRHVVVASVTKSIHITDVLAKHCCAKPRSVRWAIGDLEKSRSTHLFDQPSNLNNANVRRISYLFDRDLYDLPNPLRPRCHRDGDHSYKSMYGRLRYGSLAQTITGGFLSPGQGRFIHPRLRRTLTLHEAARLQFFPDSFRFDSVKRRTQLATMIGNAVPMKLGYSFLLELLG